jgi:hypothetical protein
MVHRDVEIAHPDILVHDVFRLAGQSISLVLIQFCRVNCFKIYIVF